MVKRCRYCGKYFRPDRRLGQRQKACQRGECKKKRKKEAQKNWCARNPEYFKGDYWRVKEWREKKKQTQLASEKKPGIQDSKAKMIQDEIPPSKPLQELVLLIPAGKKAMIQDEIILKRVDGRTFAAYG